MGAHCGERNPAGGGAVFFSKSDKPGARQGVSIDGGLYGDVSHWIEANNESAARLIEDGDAGGHGGSRTEEIRLCLCRQGRRRWGEVVGCSGEVKCLLGVLIGVEWGVCSVGCCFVHGRSVGDQFDTKASKDDGRQRKWVRVTSGAARPWR